jgi:hypothetical protein
MILRRGRKWRPRSGQFPFFCIPDKPVFFCGSSIGAGLQAPAPGTLSESFFTLLPQAAGVVEKWESWVWISTFPPPTVKDFRQLR